MAGMDEKPQRVVAGMLTGGSLGAVALAHLALRLGHGMTVAIVGIDLAILGAILMFASLGTPRLPSRNDLFWIALPAILLVSCRTAMAGIVMGWLHPQTLWFPLCFVGSAMALNSWWYPYGKDTLRAILLEDSKTGLRQYVKYGLSFCLFLAGFFVMAKGGTTFTVVAGFAVTITGAAFLTLLVATAPFVAPRRREPTAKNIAQGIAFLSAVVAIQIGVVGASTGWTSPMIYYVPLWFLGTILITHSCVKWVF
jgi:hypothetical protein